MGRLLLVLVCSLLVACSGDESSNSSSSTSSGTGGSAGSGGDATGGSGGTGGAIGGFAGVEIVFPPPVSLTDEPLLTVRGTATGALASLTVAGTAATTSDGYANWQASVPLNLGAQALSVEVVDLSTITHSEVASVAVRHDATLLNAPRRMTLDLSGNRAFVSSGNWGADTVIREIDLASGLRHVVSSQTVGSGPVFDARLIGLAYDDVAQRLLAIDQNQLWAIDPVSGNRSVVADPGTGTGAWPSEPFDLVFDGPGGRVFFSDRSVNAVVSIDLTSGDRTTISDSNVGAGPTFEQPNSLALDLANQRVLVADVDTSCPCRVTAVDLATGDRTTLSGDGVGTGPDLSMAFLAAHDAVGGHFYMGAWNRVVDVDLATGNRTLVCDSTTGTGPLVATLQALSWDGSRVLAVDDRLDAALAIDPATGNRTYVSSYALGSGPELLQPSTTAWDGDGQRIVVFDQIHAAVLGIAPEGGARALLSGPTVGSGPEPVGVEDLYVADGVALIAGYDGLIQVDLQTGDRQVVTSGSVGTGPVFVAFSAVVADPNGQQLWALDRDDPRLYTVDPDNGNRFILSDNATGTGPQIGVGLDLLFEGDRLILLKAQALLSVDRVNGDRSYLSGGNVGDGPMLQGNWMSHAGPGRVLVGGPGSVMAVDLATGDRSDICGGGTGAGPMAWMEGLVVDDQDRVWAADSELGALLAIDGVTCERVIVSK